MDRDKALIEEAVRRADSAENIREACRIALQLDRSGWQPTDPDVVAVRDVLANYREGMGCAGGGFRSGVMDDTPGFLAALAAYKKHKGGANAAD